LSNLLPSPPPSPILKVLDPALLMIGAILKLSVAPALSQKSHPHSNQVPNKKVFRVP
jgi:hypothetical protein